MSEPTGHSRMSDSAPLTTAEFCEEFKASYRPLWLLAAGMVRDPALADDVLQESAVVALGKLREFRPGTSFRAWMGAVVRYVALNHGRKEHRQRGLSLDAQGAVGEQAATAIGSRAAHPPSREMDARLMEALDEVPDTARACLLLRVVAEMPYSEISLLLNVPEGTAMSHVHRTRRLLRELLEAEQGGKRP